MESGERKAMQSSLKKRAQRMLKINIRIGKLNKRIQRMECIDMDKLRRRMERAEKLGRRMKEHARLFADERAKMEMLALRDKEESRARRMGGKPLAEAARSEKTAAAESEEAGSKSKSKSKQGKRKRTRMVRLDPAAVDRSAIPFRRPVPYPARIPDWMLALAPEEDRKIELERRALFDRILAFNQDIYDQYQLKGYVEIEITDDAAEGQE